MPGLDQVLAGLQAQLDQVKLELEGIAQQRGSRTLQGAQIVRLNARRERLQRRLALLEGCWVRKRLP